MKKTNSSMQLTRAADYAIRAMVYLATLPAQQRALLPALAQATGAPESFLSKVLQALSRAKLIASRRGQTGGFAILAFPANYRRTGVMTFLMGPNRIVYQKDLGQDTLPSAQAIPSFDPDETWSVVQ